MSFDRATRGRRRGNQAHFAHSRHCHIERSGNRRSTERQHIYLGSQGFDLFLLVHAKPLLFIHHQQAQIPKLYAFAQKLVRSHHNIEFTRFQTLQDLFAFLGRAKAVE